MICLILHGSVTLRFSFSLSFFLSFGLVAFFPFYRLPRSTHTLFLSFSISLFLCFPFLFSRGAYIQSSAILSNCLFHLTCSLQMSTFLPFFLLLLLFLAARCWPIHWHLVYSRAQNPKLVLLLNSQCVNTYGMRRTQNMLPQWGISFKIPLCSFSCMFMCVCVFVRSAMECEF